MSEPTWHLQPDGTRVLVLDVTATSSETPDEHALVTIDMTTELAERLLARMDTVKQWKEKDGEFSCAEWVDYTPSYFSVDYDAEELTGDATAPPAWSAKGERDGRTDVDRMVVGGEWVEWTAYVKNSDILLTTAALSEADLRRYVAGGNPWHDATKKYDCEACMDGGVISDTCDDCGERHCTKCEPCQEDNRA